VKLSVLVPAALLLSGCAVHDSMVAHSAEKHLMGMSEANLESCLGSPDEHSSFGNIDVLTYYAVSTSSISYSIPVIGGLGFANGGYCHATFQLTDGNVTRILYSGEKNAALAPDAYCAPIVRTCLSYLNSDPEAARAEPAMLERTVAEPPEQQSSAQVPAGTPSGTPQPGHTQAAMPRNVPTPTPR
jgi:hypothetical protein